MNFKVRSSFSVLFSASVIGCGEPRHQGLQSHTSEAIDQANSAMGFGIDGSKPWEELRKVTAGGLPVEADARLGALPGLSHALGGGSERSIPEYLPPGTATPAEVRPKTMVEQYDSYVSLIQDPLGRFERIAGLSAAEKYDFLTTSDRSPLSAAERESLKASDDPATFEEFYSALETAPYSRVLLNGRIIGTIDDDALQTAFLAGESAEHLSVRLRSQLALALPSRAPYSGVSIKIRTITEGARSVFFRPTPAREREIQLRKKEVLQAVENHDAEAVSHALRAFLSEVDRQDKIKESLGESINVGASESALREKIDSILASPAGEGIEDIIVSAETFDVEYGLELERLKEAVADNRASANLDLKRLGTELGRSRRGGATVASRFLPLTSYNWANWGRTFEVGDFAFAGHCHGAALAQTQSVRPMLPVVMSAEGGREALLMPLEIEQLMSLAWSNQAVGKRFFAGRRCEEFKGALTQGNDGRRTRVECRDLNAGVFHLALTELLGSRNEPFVFDLAQNNEIWNAVATHFTVKFEPIVSKSGKVFENGEPAPVGDIDDGLGHYRTPGTAYIVAVRASLNDSVAYDYTLELDATSRVIGGEWGPFVAAGDAGRIRETLESARPDFLWYMEKGARLGNGAVSPSILERLIACSRDEANLKTYASLVKGGLEGGEPLQAVPCSMP